MIALYILATVGAGFILYWVTVIIGALIILWRWK